MTLVVKRFCTFVFCVLLVLAMCACKDTKFDNQNDVISSTAGNANNAGDTIDGENELVFDEGVYDNGNAATKPNNTVSGNDNGVESSSSNKDNSTSNSSEDNTSTNSNTVSDNSTDVSGEESGTESGTTSTTSGVEVAPPIDDEGYGPIVKP